MKRWLEQSTSAEPLTLLPGERLCVARHKGSVGRHRVIKPPSNKGNALAASVVAGATVAAAGSGMAFTNDSDAVLAASVAPVGHSSAASTETGSVDASATSIGLTDVVGAGNRIADVAAATIRVDKQKQAAERARQLELLRPKWVRPGTGYISSCYCPRWGVFHLGIDLAAPFGAPIYAAGDGVVIEAGPASGFGYWVVVQHANGDVSIYGHMEKYLVRVGERVQAGQLIALVGAEGESTGPHLHFEVHRGGLYGQRTDPQHWLASRGVTV